MPTYCRHINNKRCMKMRRYRIRPVALAPTLKSGLDMYAKHQGMCINYTKLNNNFMAILSPISICKNDVIVLHEEIVSINGYSSMTWSSFKMNKLTKDELKNKYFKLYTTIG